MTLTLTIEDIAAAFPNYQVAAILADDMRVDAHRSADLTALIEDREASCRERHAGTPLSQIPGIAVWRDAYRQFGIKKTSYRSSIERIVKNALADRSLPHINAFVDAYNAVSLAHVFPIGADDADRIASAVAFRYGRADDSFYPLGQADAQNDPPKPGEVVLAAGNNVLCRRWNWYQDARSPITEATQRALVTVQCNGAGDLKAAADDLTDLLERFCSARCTVLFASAENPVVAFPAS